VHLAPTLTSTRPVIDDVTIEVLYFDGCPSHERLMPLVRELAAERGLEITLRRIADAHQAEQARFLGSPSVRVDGIDVEPGAGERTDFGLKCRLYRSPAGQSGIPPREWIIDALDRAAGRGA
jgi:hypothetical protein